MLTYYGQVRMNYIGPGQVYLRCGLCGAAWGTFAHYRQSWICQHCAWDGEPWSLVLCRTVGNQPEWRLWECGSVDDVNFEGYEKARDHPEFQFGVVTQDGWIVGHWKMAGGEPVWFPYF